MSRSLPCVVLLLLALAAAGCGGDDSAAPGPGAPSSTATTAPAGAPAAEVDGTAVSAADLDRQLAAIKANPAALQELQQQGSLLGHGRLGFAPAFVAQVLDSDVEALVVAAELDRRHLVVPSGLGAALSAAGDPAYAAYDATYRADLAARTAGRVVLAADLAGTPLTNDTIRAYYDEHRADYGQYCLSGLVLPSRAAAAGVRARLVAGASLPQLATRLSVDPTTRTGRGVIGCGDLGAFDEGLAKQAESLTGHEYGTPLQVGQGWYVITVASRTIPDLSAAVELVMTGMVPEYGTFNRFLDAALKAADITVDPSLGRLDLGASPPTVIAP